MDALQFEWSAEKAKQNERKHGVSFDEASSVFRDVWSPTIPDPKPTLIGRRRKARALQRAGKMI